MTTATRRTQLSRSSRLLFAALGLSRMLVATTTARWPAAADLREAGTRLSSASELAQAEDQATIFTPARPVANPADRSELTAPALARQEDPVRGAEIPDEASPLSPLDLPGLEPELSLSPASPRQLPSFAPEHSAPVGQRLAQIECRTPRSLMLHTHYGVDRMHELAEGILAAGMQTLTYADLLEGLRRGECPPENAIVVSLDDFPTSRLDPLFQEMVQAFTDRGLVLVLGVIVGDPQSPEAWAYLQEVEQLGVEIASHTIDHPNLPELGATELEQQISGSYRVICDNLGSCPVSLIVPYGSMDARGRIMQASWEYSFVVGIAGGLTIAGQAPFYVGRAGPNVHSIAHTMQVLDVTFGL